MESRGSTPAAASAVVRLGTAAEIVDAVPYLVGFQPHDSLVVVSLRGSRGRVGMTARIDLPPPERVDESVRRLVGRLRTDGASRAVVAAYPPDEGPAHPAVRALAAAFADRLAAAGIALTDMLCVHDGRWWSLTCTDPGCCPPGGTPLPEGVSVLGAAMAVEGRRVLPSREALADTLRPAGGELGAAMARALPAIDGALATRAWRGRRAEVEAESRALLRAAVERRLTGGASLGVREAARLIAGLDDADVRDEVVTWADGDWGQAARGLLSDLVRHAVPPFHVVPLTVLAWIAYQQGDAILAALAVQRALASDPGYGLARLLDDALAAGVDPAVLAPVRREIARVRSAETEA
ncbi:MAG: DUF4192 domain-containing protein [Frankiaceae bacterium]